MLDSKEVTQKLLARHPELGTKIAKATQSTASDCEVGLEEAIKFLILANDSTSHTCTPSRRVDLVWHEFILFTRLYAAFCQEYFGKFIHHEPAAAGQSCSAAYQHTLELYRQRFGPPNTSWWDLSREGTADCGMCDAM